MNEYAHLVEHLMQYSNDKIGIMSADKKQEVEAIYETMCSTISALHGNSYVMQQSALTYFKSREFDMHCRRVGISKNLMLHLVQNAPKKEAKNESALQR